MKIKNKNIIVVIGTLLLGLLLGWMFFAGGNETEVQSNVASEVAEETIWTCSMHPQIRQHEPGDCPICGMDLIPVQDEMASGNPQAVQMSEYARQLANVQTMEVGAEATSNEIRLNGKVAVDERMSYSQSTHIPGRIEQLFVNFTGEEVNRGQALARIYSPVMVTAQEELLQAYAIRESNPRLFEAAKEKLRNWRISENQINQILETQQASEQFTIISDVNGIVTKKMVELGDYVERGMPIYEITDLSQVWVLFDVYENEMTWIEEGSTVKFSVASIPGKTFEGEVVFIDPIVDPQTRVSTARVVVDNENGILKPGMFVTGIIENPIGDENVSNAVTIPKSAVLWTGKRSVVYVKQGTGTFELREVVLGPSLGDSYVISEGLQVGEEIVVNGTFAVDAAAQLAGKPSMMSPEGGGGGGSMPGMDLGEETNIQGGQMPTAEFVEGDAVDFRKQTPKAFRAQLDKVISAYLGLKEGLVEANEDATKQYSSALLVALNGLDGNLLEGKAKAFWEEKRSFIMQHAKLCKEASDIEGKRENFIYLSEPLIKVVEAFGAGKQQLYVDFCPMANNNKGAYWLSKVKEIRNPFMGEEMRTCGEVKDIINK